MLVRLPKVNKNVVAGLSTPYIKPSPKLRLYREKVPKFVTLKNNKKRKNTEKRRVCKGYTWGYISDEYKLKYKSKNVISYYMQLKESKEKLRDKSVKTTVKIIQKWTENNYIFFVFLIYYGIVDFDLTPQTYHRK